MIVLKANSPDLTPFFHIVIGMAILMADAWALS